MGPVETDIGRIVRNVAIVRLVVLVGVPVLVVVLLGCAIGGALLWTILDIWLNGPLATPTAPVVTPTVTLR